MGELSNNTFASIRLQSGSLVRRPRRVQSYALTKADAHETFEAQQCAWWETLSIH